MSRKVIQTKDNSKTLLITSNEDTYHSIHGARTESDHVFIKNGLELLRNKAEIELFEMGFGTGLNCILTLAYANDHKLKINYHTIETNPVTNDEISALNYEAIVPTPVKPYYQIIHESHWHIDTRITPYFSLYKKKQNLLSHTEKNSHFDLIYFDAFGPKSQPELWKSEVLEKLFNWLKPGGIFITYCAQGQFKRDLKSVGFKVENIPGPPGKREITRGIKPII